MSTERFSDKVAEYIRYRPGYPPALLEFMQSELGLLPAHVIADIGAGTGKLSELFLHNGNSVYAVEPNAPMRQAARNLLGDNPNFIPLNGTAERTGLSNNSVDFVVAGQAFHWFDQTAFREECRSMLRPQGRILLIWNDRDDERSAFLRDYEAFLQQYSTDYHEVDLRKIDEEDFDRFFGPENYETRRFENYQIFDFEGLRGRYLSCSYALPKGNEQYDEAMERLRELFDIHQKGGSVRMWYRTEVTFTKPPEVC